MFSESWEVVQRTALACVVAYAAVVILLRVSGKRTLSKWNAFDLVVTVALGSSLATTILSDSTSVVQGIVGFAFLILLQLLITWLSVRSRLVQRIVKAEPTALLYRGEFCSEALRRERVTESEIRAALRTKGVADLAQVAMVVLETDGTFSVITDIPPGARSTLIDVQNWPEQDQSSRASSGRRL